MAATLKSTRTSGPTVDPGHGHTTGQVRAVADDGYATGEAVGRDDAGESVVDGSGVGPGRRGRQTKQQNDRRNDRFAH